jgi:hypothetical protein
MAAQACNQRFDPEHRIHEQGTWVYANFTT